MAFDRKSWMRQWYLDHCHDPKFKAKRKEANARWRNTPQRREEARRRVAEWRRKHPEYAKWYIEKNKERLRKYNSEFSKAHPEFARASTQKRRTIIRGLPAKECANTIKALMQQSHCYWCSESFSPSRKVHIDHVTPISRGGHHVPGNLVASCSDCNNAKRNKMYWEWDGELAS